MPFFISADKKETNADFRPDGGLEGERKDEEEKEDEQQDEDDDEEEERKEKEEEQEKKKRKKQKLEKELYRVEATHPYATRSKAAAASAVATNGPATSMAPKTTKVGEPRPFNWCLDTLVVEFKAVKGDDPFRPESTLKKELEKRRLEKDSTPVCFEKDTGSARRIRGQLALYAREMFNHQQRTHLFQLLVAGDIARIIYFDHAGAIVSERIDYIQDGSTLGEFFWRINHMTDKARGLDMTSVIASQSDKDMFTSVVKELVANMNNPNHPQRSIPSAEITLDAHYPIYKMTVHEGVPRQAGAEQGEETIQTKSSQVATMELIVQRPIFDAPSPLGRATRGYIAVPVTANNATSDEQESDSTHDVSDIKSPEPLFLKDTWRVDHAMLKAENEVYRLLEKYGVERIPRLVCGGDVRDADGQVQRTISAEWAMRVQQDLGITFAELRLHLHHRLVQRLAYPIESAEKSEEMVRAFYDVLGGKWSISVVLGGRFSRVLLPLSVIEEAYEKMPTKVLHRDLSVGNVMLGEDEDEKVGLLADWDHASETKPDGEYTHQLFRTVREVNQL